MTILVRNFVLPVSQTVDWPFISQLRQGRDNENGYSRYVLPRIARLTIETNTFTGTFIEPLPISFRLTFFSATVAIVSFALYIGYPVSEIKYTYYYYYSD